MSGKIVALHGQAIEGRPSDPDPEVIRQLEHWLEQARAGEVVGFAIAVMGNRGGVPLRSTSWAAAKVETDRMIAGIERLKWRFMRSVDAQDAEDDDA